MRRKNLLLTALFLIAAMLVNSANAQGTKLTDEDKERILQEIEFEKKAMNEQRELREALQKANELQRAEMQKLNELQREATRKAIESQREVTRIQREVYGNNYFSDSLRSVFREMPSIIPTVSTPNFINSSDVFVLGVPRSNVETSKWELFKTIKENTFSKDYTFEIDKTTKAAIMSITGNCTAGEIRVKIVMPNGTNYLDMLIDNSGNMNWRKTITITETENQDKIGDWTCEINSSKATGQFRITIQTN